MERKELRGGLPGGGRRAAGPCEGAALVQRTQVLLLPPAEPGDPDGGRALLSSFAQHATPSPGEPSAEPPPPPPSGQLIFFLCRPPSLRERPERLREVLRGMRDRSSGAPSAVVGVVVQPRPDEEPEARERLADLLREVFPGEGAVEAHTAVFAPGRPEGALELRRVSAQRDGNSLWLDKSMLMQIFGAMLSMGTVVYGGYYFYNHPPA